MPEAPEPREDEHTAEGVALRLFRMIAQVEGRGFGPGAPNKADRRYILTTYKACLATVKGQPPRTKEPARPAAE